jgi:hypothetical protein
MMIWFSGWDFWHEVFNLMIRKHFAGVLYSLTLDSSGFFRWEWAVGWFVTTCEMR